METGKEKNMRLKKIIKLFKNGNVCVCGLRGTGKDILFGNVIARRKKDYISNLDYTQDSKHIPLNYNDLNCGKNDFKNLVCDNINYYKFPHSYETDVYISDVGIYFPSQYCGELNKEFKYLPTYFALSRQVSRNNVHINVQNLNRCWDKIREQSDIYIMCLKCFVIFGFVIQQIRIYDKYQSCVDRIKPCRVTKSLLNRDSNIDIYLDNFYNIHGKVKNAILVYKNYSKHNTYYFENLFERGLKK